MTASRSTHIELADQCAPCHGVHMAYMCVCAHTSVCYVCTQVCTSSVCKCVWTNVCISIYTRVYVCTMSMSGEFMPICACACKCAVYTQACRVSVYAHMCIHIYGYKWCAQMYTCMQFVPEYTVCVHVYKCVHLSVCLHNYNVYVCALPRMSEWCASAVHVCRRVCVCVH